MTTNITEAPASGRQAVEEALKTLKVMVRDKKRKAALAARKEPEAPPMPAVRVSLTGKAAAGVSMIVDEPIWTAVSARFGDAWSLTRVGGRDYICTARRSAVEAARGVANKTTISLARLLLWLRDGEAPGAVYYKNGNPLDLRLKNLTKRQRDVARLRAPRASIRVEPYVEEAEASAA